MLVLQHHGFNFPVETNPFNATVSEIVSAWMYDVCLVIIDEFNIRDIIGSKIINKLDSNIVINETQNILALRNKNYTFTEEGEIYIIHSLSKEGLPLTITIPVNWVESVGLIMPSKLGV